MVGRCNFLFWDLFDLDLDTPKDASFHQDDITLFSREFLQPFICHRYWVGGASNKQGLWRIKIWILSTRFFPHQKSCFPGCWKTICERELLAPGTHLVRLQLWLVPVICFVIPFIHVFCLFMNSFLEKKQTCVKQYQFLSFLFQKRPGISMSPLPTRARILRNCVSALLIGPN